MTALAIGPDASAQQSLRQYLPPYVIRGIDSALAAVLMTRADMTMRWDATGNDIHRLSEIKRLFSDPLASFTLADSMGNAAAKGIDNPVLLFKSYGALLDIGEGLVDPNRPTMTDAEIRLYAKISIDSIDFRSALFLRRFLSLAMATEARVIANRNQIDSGSFARLVAYSDTLMLQSEDAGEATLVEMKAAERYGLKRSKQYFNEDANALNYGRLLSPGVSLFTNALEQARAMQAEVARSGDSIQTRIWKTPFGKIALGGAGDDVYDGTFFCIVDVGGNDIYKSAPQTKRQAVEQGVTLIVDFDGNDTYIAQDYSLGGTLFGAATVIDMKGNDNYQARNFSLGCGYFGVGALFDGAGSDQYSGGTCVQGAGLFGIGLLMDVDGNDRYMAHLESQGFGFTRGIGGIIDGNGNDSYMAASPYIDYLRYDDHYETFCQGAALGSRPVSSGGYGYIAELGGSDTYVADIYGQGTAYWYGFGAIIDRKGNDSYTAFQYAQGSGVHLASGVLLDNAGNDNYVSHGVSQGCGHDIAFGGLYDAKGDDNYVVESLSLGAGNADAISLFIDGGGEDGYIARRTNTMGYSDIRRMYGMIGVFLDLEGTDFYGTARGGNDSLWTNAFYGAGLDGNLRPKSDELVATDEPAPKKKSDEEIAAELGKDYETLFIQASAAPQKYQYIVEPARKKLVEDADNSLPFLLSQLGTESARESLALGVMLPRIGKRVVPALIDTLRRGDRSRIGMAIYILGEIKDSSAALALGEKLVDTSSWRVRASAGEAILKMDGRSARAYLIRALKDTVELVRGRAARALALFADSADLRRLLPLLDDDNQIVRYQTQMGLQQRGADSIASFLVSSLLSERPGFSHDLLYSLAPSLKEPRARGRLLDGLLQSKQPKLRAQGVRLALAWGDEKSIHTAAQLKRTEKNSLVLFELDKLPDEKQLREERERERKRRKTNEDGVSESRTEN